MTATYAAGVAAVPSSGLEWRQWVRWIVEELGLSSGEANMLRLLADRASGAGRVRLGVPLIARQLVLSESQAYRLLSRLADRGLLHTRQQGKGRVAVRELVAVPEPVQLSLFDQPDVVGPAPVEAAEVPASPWAPAPVVVGEACPRIDASMPSHQREAAVVGQPTAKDVCENAPAHEPRPAVLSPSLQTVLEILEQAGENAYVEAAHIDIVLRSFPHADHLEAARYVLLQLLQPDCRCRTASLLLHTQLKRNDRERRTPLPGAPHGGRRRVAPPQPAKVSPEGRRWGPIAGNKYDRAAGLTP